MAIHGIGVDLEEVARISAMIGRWGRSFTTKLFTDREIEYCDQRPVPHQHYAARFAAKEALSKAMGTGWADRFRWKDAEVQNDRAGKPHVILHNHLAEAFPDVIIHLSMSHTATHVTAMVVIERTA
jgi:holo-[acyl-carrier protein] synthase